MLPATSPDLVSTACMPHTTRVHVQSRGILAEPRYYPGRTNESDIPLESTARAVQPRKRGDRLELAVAADPNFSVTAVIYPYLTAV